MQITYYFRPDCGLCKEIEPALERLAHQFKGQVTRVDIDQDAAARRLYWDKIPVIIVAGQPPLVAPISEQELHQVFVAASQSGNSR